MLSILLDIKEQQGVMTAQLMEAGRSRARMEDKLKAVAEKVERIEPVVAVVADMKPKVENLIELRNRAAAVVVVAGFVVSAAFGLIFAGIKQFGPEVGKLFSKWTA